MQIPRMRVQRPGLSGDCLHHVRCARHGGRCYNVGPLLTVGADQHPSPQTSIGSGKGRHIGPKRPRATLNSSFIGETFL